MSDRPGITLRNALIQAINGNPITPDEAWQLLHEWDEMVAERDEWITKYGDLSSEFSRRVGA